MIEYILCFILTCVATAIAQMFFSGKKKAAGVFFSCIAILLPSALAGLRDNTIGIDLLNYVDPLFYMAKTAKDLPHYISMVPVEPLYATVNYVIAQFTSNPHWLYFIISLIPMIFIYLALYEYRSKVPMWLAMAFYLLIYYNNTLNLVRQTVAVGICFYSLKHVYGKQPIRFFLWVLIAYLFHASAIVYAAVYVIYWVIQKKYRPLALVGIIALVMVIVVFFDYILATLLDYGLVSERYEIYRSSGGLAINVMETIARLPILAAVILFYSQLKKYDGNTLFFITLLIIDIIVVQLSVNVEYIQRLSMYFGLPQIIVVSELICLENRSMSRNKVRQVSGISFGLGAIFLLAFGFYWYYSYVYRGFAVTYPYTSQLLYWFWRR